MKKPFLKIISVIALALMLIARSQVCPASPYEFGNVISPGGSLIQVSHCEICPVSGPSPLIIGAETLAQKWMLAPGGEFSLLLNPSAELRIFSDNLFAMTTVTGAAQSILEQGFAGGDICRDLAESSLCAPEEAPVPRSIQAAPRKIQEAASQPLSVRAVPRRNVFTAPVPQPPPAFKNQPAPARKAPALPKPQDMLLFGGAACAVVLVRRKRRGIHRDS